MGCATQRGPRPRLVATSHRPASCVIVNGFRAALDLDTYPLRNLIRPRCTEWAKSGRGKPVLIMHISFFACFYAIFLALVALKVLVLLISRLVACSARVVVDRQTDRQTDTQTKYCNPRCACAPRVNYMMVGVYMSLTETVLNNFCNNITVLIIEKSTGILILAGTNFSEKEVNSLNSPN